MSDRTFFVTLNLDAFSAEMAGLDSTLERGEWIEGFQVAAHGHSLRSSWSEIKIRGFQFGAQAFQDAEDRREKLAHAGRRSAEVRKTTKGTAQPEHLPNIVRTSFGECSEHPAEHQPEHLPNQPIPNTHYPIPMNQNPKPRSPSTPSKVPESLVLEIYQAYPRHEAKQHALRTIRKALETVSPEILLEAVTAYAKAVETWSEADREYIPLPASWIRAGRWEDDRTKWIRGFPTSKPQRKGVQFNGFAQTDYKAGLAEYNGGED